MDYTSLSTDELRRIRGDSHNLDERIGARAELDRRDREERGENRKERKWTRDQKFAFIVAVGTVLLIILAAAVVPEVRGWFHLKQESTTETPTRQETPTPPASIPETKPQTPQLKTPDQRRQTNVTHRQSMEPLTGGALGSLDIPTGLPAAIPEHLVGPVKKILLGSVWEGQLPGGEVAKYRFLEDGTVEIHCKVDPKCDERYLVMWTLEGDKVSLSFEITPEVSGEIEVSGAGGKVGKHTISGTIYDGKNEKKWKLTKQVTAPAHP